MKKIIILLYLVSTIALLTIGCNGWNGNPLELVGDWKITKDLTTTNSETCLFTFYSDGTYEFDQTFSDNTPKIIYKGNYYGDTTTSPKSLSFSQTSCSANNSVQKYDVVGTYVIQYTTPNRLSIKLFDKNPSGVFNGNPDYSGLFSKQ